MDMDNPYRSPQSTDCHCGEAPVLPKLSRVEQLYRKRLEVWFDFCGVVAWAFNLLMDIRNGRTLWLCVPIAALLYMTRMWWRNLKEYNRIKETRNEV